MDAEIFAPFQKNKMPINPIDHPIKLTVENFISCLKSPRAKKTELAINKSESLSIDTKYPETV